MKLERRSAFGELRAKGRRVIGPALRYGDVSPSHRERFEPGAIDVATGRTYWLDREHNQEIVLAHTGSGLELRAENDGLFIEAELAAIPAADRALEDVKSGMLTGLSVEFHALQERQEAGIRVIESAELIGVALVKHPSYQQSVAELRNADMALPIWILS